MKAEERWTGNDSAGPVEQVGDEATAEAAAEKEIMLLRFIEMHLSEVRETEELLMWR